MSSQPTEFPIEFAKQNSQNSSCKTKKQIVRPPRTQYSKISKKQRKLFISYVLSNTYTVKEAARKAEINYNTAHVIFKVYKEQHRIGKKQNRQKKNSSMAIQSSQTQQIFHQKVINLNEIYAENIGNYLQQLQIQAKTCKIVLNRNENSRNNCQVQVVTSFLSQKM